MATEPATMAATADQPETIAATTTSSTTPVRGNTSNPHLKRSQPSSSSTAKSGKSTATNSTTTTATLQTKKRPYRRTKRPKNYCDKSTVTTVTTPTRQDDAEYGPNPDGTNVYDAVLGECEDLLRASTEAQRLGRLKMASAYQLLLHTRLVGLGKRFDRSAMMVDQQKARQQEQQSQQKEAQPRKQLDMEASLSSSGPGGISNQSNTESGASEPPLAADEAPPDEDAPVPEALQQLRSILPGNLEMDASMMEHLARAAVELHHQRTGRRKSADGLLASPLNGGLAAAALAVASEPAPEETTSKPPTKKSSVAWAKYETDIVIKALKEGKDNYTIASTLLPNKTVAQVHAFVKNQLQLHKVNKLTQRQQEQQQQQQATTAGAAPASASLEDESKPQAVASSNTTDNIEDGNAPAGGAAPPRRGGRGRKPPTTAMNTVPNISMDVRALLRKANQKKPNPVAATTVKTEAEPPANKQDS